MWLSSCCGAISRNVVEALNWWQERDSKHQSTTSSTTMVEKLEIEVLGNAHLEGCTSSLACACEILGLDGWEQKKGNRKLILKYILRLLNSKVRQGSDDGSFWNYTIKFFRKAHAPFDFKQKSELSKNDLFDSNRLPQIFSSRN